MLSLLSLLLPLLSLLLSLLSLLLSLLSLLLPLLSLLLPLLSLLLPLLSLLLPLLSLLLLPLLQLLLPLLLLPLLLLLLLPGSGSGSPKPTVTLSATGGDVTGFPAGSDPVAVATFVTEPASRSACVIVWLAVHVIVSPGAKVAGAPGQFSSVAMSSSIVIGWLIVPLPEFVTR